MEGRIIKYIDVKGYGFIKTDQGENIFFHKDNVTNPDNIKVLSKAIFDIEPLEKGPSAIHVKIESSRKPTHFDFGNCVIETNNVKEYASYLSQKETSGFLKIIPAKYTLYIETYDGEYYSMEELKSVIDREVVKLDSLFK